MATVTIEDTTASGQIDVADSSLLGKSQLQALVCGTKDFLRELPGPLNQVKFKSASFTVKFQSPVIPITGAFGLCISTGQSAQPGLCTGPGILRSSQPTILRPPSTSSRTSIG